MGALESAVRTAHAVTVKFDLLRPWRPVRRLVGQAGFALTSMPIGIVTFTTVVTLASVTAGLLITFVLALPFAWLLFVTSRGLARLQRSRVAALTGVGIGDPVPPLTAPGWLSRLHERVRSGARWRELGHHVAALPVGVLGFALTVAAWGGSVALLAMPAVVHAMPGDSAKFYFFELHPGVGAWLAALVGAVGLAVVAPWLTRGVVNVELAMARSLLGPTAEQRSASRITRLETSRSAAVDSAEAERRRIERDLHDGAQQRLVALAANLGSAQRQARRRRSRGRAGAGRRGPRGGQGGPQGDPRPGPRHPPGDPRGPWPRRRPVGGRRPVARPRHARRGRRRAPAGGDRERRLLRRQRGAHQRGPPRQATRAEVTIARAGDRLIIEVRDDGVGGADPRVAPACRARERVTAIGGSMDVISPQGGPTTISVELPCGS